MKGFLREDASAASAGSDSPRSLHPTRKLLESRVTLNNIFQHTQMDAERLNQLEARLENLGQRLEDLRGYL